jgi:hypothetical protein
MLLIAAAAIGFWLARMLVISDAAIIPGSKREAWRALVGASYLLILGMTLGIAIVRLRSPRPPIRNLARQPGFLAGVAVASIVVLGTGLSILDWFTFWGRLQTSEAVVSSWLHGFLLSIGGPWNVGFAVSLAWIIGGLQGFRWRQPDWVEWAGRFVGVLSILYWLLLLALK